MRFSFTKMHGLGNDFVVIDARAQPIVLSAARARAIADRRLGIGCDQLIVLEASDTADARMRTWNPDGGEVEICGNATRAVALLLGQSATLETAAGPIAVRPEQSGASVDMGWPRFDWQDIPLAYAMDTGAMPVGWDELQAPACVNVGNPHAVFFVGDCEAVALDRLGPVIEHDPLFPERVNVEVATVEGPGALRLVVWERGTGLTRACGTGACAAAVVAIRKKLVTAPVTVSLPGGDLIIDWAEGGTITMTGPATHVFTGEADMAAFG